MGVIPTPIDYTDLDFDALRTRVYAVIGSIFPDWTDQNVADFGNLLIESFAFIGGIISYYQDAQAAETRWTTATQRKNLLNLTKMIGFTPATQQPAKTNEQFVIASGGTGSVTLVAGTKCSTLGPSQVDFQMSEDVTVPAGPNPRTIIAQIENSVSREDLFAATGLPSQQCRLATTPFIDHSAVVAAGNGDFEEVDNFLESGPTDLHFRVDIDQNDRGFVVFGNGTNGAIPSGTISVKYRTGGGPSGNVDANTIRQLGSSFTDEFGNPVAITINNPGRAEGGIARQTIAQIQQLAPLSIRARTRSVSKDDFEINARTVPQVARVLMLSNDQDSSVPENTGILFVVPFGGGLVPQSVKDDVLKAVTVTYPCTITFQVLVQDTPYVNVNFYAVVFPKQGVLPSKVRSDILGALTTWFQISNSDNTPNLNVDFGYNIKNSLGRPAGSIPFSDLFDVVKDVTSVFKIGAGVGDFLVNGAHADVTIASNQFPVLGTVTLINGNTGLPL